MYGYSGYPGYPPVPTYPPMGGGYPTYGGPPNAGIPPPMHPYGGFAPAAGAPAQVPMHPSAASGFGHPVHPLHPGSVNSGSSYLPPTHPSNITVNPTLPPYSSLSNRDEPLATVFVGGIDAHVTSDMLRAAFSPFGDVRSTVTAPAKHCGWVNFFTAADADRAIRDGHGMVIGGCRVRLQHKAQNRRSGADSSSGFGLSSSSSNPAPPPPPPSNSDIFTVFVGNVETGVTVEDLRQAFSQFGSVVSAVVGAADKHCGWVEFRSMMEAERAIKEGSGMEIHGTPIRCQWGKNRVRNTGAGVSDSGGSRSRRDRDGRDRGDRGGGGGRGGIGYQPHVQDQYSHSASPVTTSLGPPAFATPVTTAGTGGFDAALSTSTGVLTNGVVLADEELEEEGDRAMKTSADDTVKKNWEYLQKHAPELIAVNGGLANAFGYDLLPRRYQVLWEG